MGSCCICDQWRCAIRYPLGWNAAKADLQKETMAECLIAVKYGKYWQMLQDFFEDLPESTNDFYGHGFHGLNRLITRR